MNEKSPTTKSFEFGSIVHVSRYIDILFSLSSNFKLDKQKINKKKSMALHTYSLLFLVILISTTSACHYGSLKKQVAGESTYVCLHFGNNNTNAFAYNVKVDKMVRLTVQNDSIIIFLYLQ